MRRAREYLRHGPAGNMGSDAGRRASGRVTNARACWKFELGRKKLGRALLCVLDFHLSHQDESSRESCRIHENAIVVRALRAAAIALALACRRLGAPARMRKHGRSET